MLCIVVVDDPIVKNNRLRKKTRGKKSINQEQLYQTVLIVVVTLPSKSTIDISRLADLL